MSAEREPGERIPTPGDARYAPVQEALRADSVYRSLREALIAVRRVAACLEEAHDIARLQDRAAIEDLLSKTAGLIPPLYEGLGAVRRP